MGDYPRALYHTAIKRPRNIFGKTIEGAEPVHTGDLTNPNYPIPLANAADLQTKGQAIGGIHLIPQRHYKTIVVGIYDASGKIDEIASKAEEERLAKEGWVRHPDLLKEEYDD